MNTSIATALMTLLTASLFLSARAPEASGSPEPSGPPRAVTADYGEPTTSISRWLAGLERDLRFLAGAPHVR